MDPVFTLSYPEYCVAQRLSELFKDDKKLSIYIPLSRQEKGVDLIAARRSNGHTLTSSFQVKASRTYFGQPPKRTQKQVFQYNSWFKKFACPEEADFVCLLSLFPSTEEARRHTSRSVWKPLVLLFTRNEMSTFLSNVKTAKGLPDSYFGFGFDTLDEIIHTRGHSDTNESDYSGFLIEHRKDLIDKFLSA